MVMELKKKMSGIDDVFNALLFGSGSWLGLIIIVSIIVTVALLSKNRVANIIFAIISIFMGIEYFTHVSASSNFMWSGIVMFVLAVFLGYGAIKGK